MTRLLPVLTDDEARRLLPFFESGANVGQLARRAMAWRALESGISPTVMIGAMLRELKVTTQDLGTRVPRRTPRFGFDDFYEVLGHWEKWLGRAKEGV